MQYDEFQCRPIILPFDVSAQLYVRRWMNENEKNKRWQKIETIQSKSVVKIVSVAMTKLFIRLSTFARGFVLEWDHFLFQKYNQIHTIPYIMHFAMNI